MVVLLRRLHRDAFILLALSVAQPAVTKCPCIGSNYQPSAGQGMVMTINKGPYPDSYGESCKAHAEPGVPDCQKAPPAAWCNASWCYVDPCFCDGPTDIGESDYFKVTDDKRLFYSYEACGSTDEYNSAKCPGLAKDQCQTDDDCNWDVSVGRCAVATAKVETARATAGCSAINMGSFGAQCMCIGTNGQETVDNNGEPVVMVDNNPDINPKAYAPDYGKYCKSHAEPGHSSCTGPNPATWCSTPWCYVDPCKCNGPTDFGLSDYFSSTADGNPLYYSYEACGSTDAYSAEKCSGMMSSQACKAEDECVLSVGKSYTSCVLNPERVYGPRVALGCPPLKGADSCQCIGSNGQTVVDGKVLTDKLGFAGHKYPADYGAQCTPHAEPGSPACTSNFPAAWCKEPWCYIDPCNCDDPKIGLSDYFSTSQSGKSLYYSYATCGSADAYNAEKCAAITSEKLCNAEDECRFDSGQCTRLLLIGQAVRAAKKNHGCPEPSTLQNPKCPCIGSNFQKRAGEGVVRTKSMGLYPDTYGETCMPHAEPGAAACQTDPPAAWCQSPWCYVDPCFCDGPLDIGVSDYFEVTEGRTLFYSYEACGSVDAYNAARCPTFKSAGACLTDVDCSWDPSTEACAAATSKVDDAKITAGCSAINMGSLGAQCMCIGSNKQEISDNNGEPFVLVHKASISPKMYPSDYGQSCKAHKEPGVPDCNKGLGSAEWCGSSWCYVDPCKCNGPMDFGLSDYFDTTVDGKPLYYSYAACGSADAYNEAKCANFNTKDECNAEDECTVTGTQPWRCLPDPERLEVPRITSGCGSLMGSASCPCLGSNGQDVVDRKIITNKPGFEGHKYPADYGHMCTPHAEPGWPSCKGNSPASWCMDAWCYVDPCNCNDLSLGLSDYFTTTVTSKPLYYSYATCGSPDDYNKNKCAKLKFESCDAEDECKWVAVDSKCIKAPYQEVLDFARENWGGCPTLKAPNCPCIGTNYQTVTASGTILTARIDGKQKVVEYPASYGASCTAHLEPGVDACNGAEPPAWCSSHWCYVDPCFCHGPSDLGESDYFDKIDGGKALFFSYEACGTVDSYNSVKCPRYAESVCKSDDDCSWDGGSMRCSVSSDKLQAARDKASCAAVNMGVFGAACMCTGANRQERIDLNGKPVVKVHKDTINPKEYASDYGEVCKAHAEPGHSSCNGPTPADWCSTPWCYVDPCKCNGPSDFGLSDYFHSTLDDKPLYYSYEVCGSTDGYSKEKCEKLTDWKACKEEDECSVDEAGTACGINPERLKEPRTKSDCGNIKGVPECLCTGTNGQTAVDGFVITDKPGFSGHKYPIDYGQQCTPHSEPGASACSGNFPASWCRDAWCYVDPCSCNDPNIARSDYFSNTTSGKPLYYSYSTCGSPDDYNMEKCKGITDKDLCTAEDECTYQSGCRTKTGNLPSAREASGCGTTTDSPSGLTTSTTGNCTNSSCTTQDEADGCSRVSVIFLILALAFESFETLIF